MGEEKTFRELLEEFLGSPDHPLFEQHMRYNLEGVERGEHIASTLALKPPLDGKRVIDVGCGTGGISVAFAKMGAEVHAMEPNYTHPMLMDITKTQAAEEGVSLNMIIGRGERIPYADEAFDIVILNDVIEHVEEPFELVEEAIRVLSPDGLLYMSTPNKYSYSQIISEGHSGLFGVSLLPPRLAAFYVVRIWKRRERYTVKSIHSYGQVRRYLDRLGVNFVLMNRNRPARHFRIHHPDRPPQYRNKLIDMIMRICRIPVLSDILAFLASRPSLQPGMLEFVVSKGVIPEPVLERYRTGAK
jgi:ubiquinone/menaquinone biosynthesis C-methylase UbiE